MRFRRSITPKNYSFTMNPDMYRLFFALNENITMSQIASQLQMDLALARDCISKLWSQGLIEPVGMTNLCVDLNFVKLLKIILYYILGRKKNAYTCVDTELGKLGFSQDRLPANRAADLVAAISTKISDPKIRQHFRELSESLVPLRAKMMDVLTASVGHHGPAEANGTTGRARQIIDRIIAIRSGGNPTIAKNIKTKLLLKGIDPDSYNDDTLDSPKTLDKLRRMAATMGVALDVRQNADENKHSSKGQIRSLILKIIQDRSKGNPVVAKNIRTKLFLKGIDVDSYGPDTPDNPAVLDRVKNLAATMGVPG
jgi:hypothetical protein